MVVQQGLDLNEFIRVISESRWRVARIVVLFLLCALAYLITVPPVYQADTLLQVEERSKSLSAIATTSQILEDQVVITDKIRILKSRQVLGQVVDDLRLDIIARPEYFPVLGDVYARWSKKLAGWAPASGVPGAEAGAGNSIVVETFEVPESYLGKKFRLVAADGGGYVLLAPNGQAIGAGKAGERVEMRLDDRDRIAIRVAVLEAAAQTPFSLKREPRLKAIEDLKMKLKVDEPPSLPGREPKFGLLRVSLEGDQPDTIRDVVNKVADVFLQQNLDRKFSEADKTLKYLEEQVQAVKEQMDAAETELNTFRLRQGSVDLSKETLTVLDRSLAADVKLSELKRERGELIQKFTPQHARIITLDAQIEGIHQEQQGLERRIRTLPGIQQSVLRLSRQVEVSRALYTMLLNKAQELKVVRAGAEGDMRVIDMAVSPIEPIRPNKGLVIAIAAVLGLFAGVGRVLLSKSVRAGIDDPDQIERHLGLTVYAVVPSSEKQRTAEKRLGKSDQRHAVLAVTETDDSATESLRNLRTALNFMREKVANNVTVVTGPAPGVGKSFISVNLAALWANTGRKVLIIDADFRRGSIHNFFDLKRGIGLSDVIRDEADLTGAIRETPIENLFVLSAGTMPDNPSELLLNSRFSEVLKNCADAGYDHIIIDSPPALGVSDAAVLGQHAGITLLVVKAGQTSLRELKQTVKNLNQAGVNPAGVVFNSMSLSSSSYGYSRYYGYAYDYKTK